MRRYRRCGKDGCSEDLYEVSKDNAVCFHCGGNHEVGENQCERRKKILNDICGGNKESEGRKWNWEEKQDRPRKGGKQQRQYDRETINIDTVQRKFLAFIAMVINCASEIKIGEN